MNKIETSNFSCDVETGVCSPKDDINQEEELRSGTATKSRPKLIYYYDALCGWCYGFSPVISRLSEEYGDKVDIEVISGGLFLGSRSGFVNEVAPHIKAGAYKSVESMTGVKFGGHFLADVFGDGLMTLNSLPPSMALCIVKEKFPEKALEFAAMLLKAVYYDGIDPIDIEAYSDYVEKTGFDTKEFRSKMKDKKYEEIAKKEFEKFQTSGLGGMPTLVLETGGDQVLLSSGYANFEDLKLRLGQYGLDLNDSIQD